MKRIASLMLFFMFPAFLAAETLDLSALQGEFPEAQMIEEPFAWYELPDGSDSRILPDGSVLVTLSATGDVTIGGDRRKKGKSVFDKQLDKEELGLSFPLSNVRHIFEEDDLTLVNFEGTLTDTKSATKNTYSFAAPPSYVKALTSASVEAVSLENNHVMDHGEQGYQDTCKTLEDAGILYCGHMGPAVFETDTGVRIGLLAYQTFNGNYARIYDSIEGDIAALREQDCLIVIVSYHWGEEKDYVPNERQVPLGRATIDAGADLVVGHHSHRMNPIEEYKGKYICYSLGNFSFAGNTRPDDMDTFIFQQRFRITPEGSCENAGFRIVPCSISSQERFNDFKPTPKDADGAAAIVARLMDLGRQFEKRYDSFGVMAVSGYPVEW
ncbi:MAG: CapA family protein [Clostridiales bacterium]|nr:CapA family protein [Clostridiales bacterium]